LRPLAIPVISKNSKDREAQGDSYNAAAKYAMLGDKNAAFANLEEEFVRHGVVDMNIEPKFDGIRSDPRFTDLLHRIGLPKMSFFKLHVDSENGFLLMPRSRFRMELQQLCGGCYVQAGPPAPL
jgi:hypothetical protein